MTRRPPRSKAPARPGRASKTVGKAAPGKSNRGAKATPKRASRPSTTPEGRSRGLGGDQVEGRQAVRELLLAGHRKVYEIHVATDQDDSEILTDIIELAAGAQVKIREVSAAKLASLASTQSPQGVVARAKPLEVRELDSFFEGRGRRTPLLLGFDGVTDPGNLGAALRVAECAGITGVVLPRHRSVHVTPAVTKTAAGAVEHVPMALVGGLPAALDAAKKRQVWSVGFSDDASDSLYDLQLIDEPLLLVFGAEGTGLSRLVKQRCDAVVQIPLAGEIGSLNVATSVAVAAFEIQRRRGRLGTRL